MAFSSLSNTMAYAVCKFAEKLKPLFSNRLSLKQLVKSGLQYKCE